MYADRLQRYRQIEVARGSRVITYVTGDRQGAEAHIANDVWDHLVNHLDSIGVTDKISLILYTRGGDTLAAWSLVNLIKIFCDSFEVIIPSKAHSAGTLISLAADRIVMTKQATLGPIDPSVITPLNPQLLPGAPDLSRVPVSVEDMNGYLAFARESLGESGDMNAVFLRLSEVIHPLVLGRAHRSRSQIRMLARKLLEGHMNDVEKIERILAFLCADSGSHDYTINRREAEGGLGLPVEKASAELYLALRAVYDDFAQEMEFDRPHVPARLATAGTGQGTPYRLVRGLVESTSGGSDVCVSEGQVVLQQVPGPHGPQQGFIDQRTFDGWKHYDPPN